MFFRAVFPILLKGKDVDVFFYEGDKGAAVVGDVPKPDGKKDGEEAQGDAKPLNFDDEDEAALLPLLDPSRRADWEQFGSLMTEGKKRCVAAHGAHRVLAFVAVDPDSQGQGIGSSLLEAVIADSRERGIPVFLESSSAASAKLYARVGFRVLAEERFGDPDGEEGVTRIQVTLMATSLGDVSE